MTFKSVYVNVIFAAIFSNIILLCRSQQSDESPLCESFRVEVRNFINVIADSNDFILNNEVDFFEPITNESFVEAALWDSFVRLVGNLSVMVQPFQNTRKELLDKLTTCDKDVSQSLADVLNVALNYRLSLLQKLSERRIYVENLYGGQKLFGVLTENSIQTGIVHLILMIEEADPGRLDAFRQHCRQNDPLTWMEEFHSVQLILRKRLADGARMSSSVADSHRIILFDYLKSLLIKTQLAMFLTPTCMGVTQSRNLTEPGQLKSTEWRIHTALLQLIGASLMRLDRGLPVTLHFGMTFGKKHLNMSKYGHMQEGRDRNNRMKDIQTQTNELQDQLNERIHWLEWRVFGYKGKFNDSSDTNIDLRLWYYQVLSNSRDSLNYTRKMLADCDITSKNGFITLIDKQIEGNALPVLGHQLAIWNWIPSVRSNHYKNLQSMYVKAYKNFVPDCSKIEKGVTLATAMQPLLDMKVPLPLGPFIYFGEKHAFYHQHGRFFQVDVCSNYAVVFGY